MLKDEKVFVSSGEKKASFWHENNDRAKPTPKAEPPSEPQS